MSVIADIARRPALSLYSAQRETGPQPEYIRRTADGATLGYIVTSLGNPVRGFVGGYEPLELTHMSTTHLALALQANVPALWWGDSGIGKTAIAISLGATLGLPVVVISAAYLQPEDISGIPIPGEGRALSRRYDGWAVQCHEQATLLVIDELTRASSRATRNALLRVIQERVLGDLALHPGTVLIATANPSSVDPDAGDLPAALANRMFHETGEPDVSEWVDWMGGGPGATASVKVLPIDWARGVPEALATVGAYIRANPGELHKRPTDPILAAGPWPSRRSWANAARLLAAARRSEIADDDMLLVSGTVGPGAAIGLFAYLRDLDLPTADELVVAGAPNWGVPKRTDRAYAQVAALVGWARGRATAEAYSTVGEFLCRAADHGHVDIGVAGLIRLVANGAIPVGWRPDVGMTQRFGAVLKVGVA